MNMAQRKNLRGDHLWILATICCILSYIDRITFLKKFKKSIQRQFLSVSNITRNFTIISIMYPLNRPSLSGGPTYNSFGSGLSYCSWVCFQNPYKNFGFTSKSHIHPQLVSKCSCVFFSLAIITSVSQINEKIQQIKKHKTLLETFLKLSKSLVEISCHF